MTDAGKWHGTPSRRQRTLLHTVSLVPFVMQSGPGGYRISTGFQPQLRNLPSLGNSNSLKWASMKTYLCSTNIWKDCTVRTSLRWFRSGLASASAHKTCRNTTDSVTASEQASVSIAMTFVLLSIVWIKWDNVS